MQEKEIQLIFDPGKGSVSLRSVTALQGDRVGALPTPTRRGYTFGGWYTHPDGKGQRITAETVADETFDESVTLYALWEATQKAPKTQKKKTSLGTQKKALWAMAILAVVLIVGLIVVKYVVDIYSYVDTDGTKYTIKKSNGVYGLYYDGAKCDVNDDGYYLTRFGNQLIIDPESGEYEIYAVVDVEGTEVVGVNQRVLMFKQLTYDASSTKDMSRVLKRIDVTNEYGRMVFVRGENNRFMIEGHESTYFSDELFAKLSSGCGYTISQQRLENPVRLPDGSIDLSEYGLVSEERTRTDEEGKEVTYTYTPAHYTLTTMTDETYSVTLGDATVSGAGYYAMYEDRQTIYILSSANLGDAALQPIETLVTPMMVYPMSMNAYFNVLKFTYRTNIDYVGVTNELVYDLTGYDISDLAPDPETGKYPEEAAAKIQEAQEKLAAMDEKDSSAMYERLLEKHSKLVTAFSYIDMAEREKNLYSSIPYQMATDYMDGYFPNSDNISDVLYNLYSTTFNKVEKLGPSDEDLEAFGLGEAAHILSFIYVDAEGYQHDNYVEISAKTEDGLYYAYSPYFDMIVSLPESSLQFLEWEDIDWYEREYYLANIAHCTQIKLEGVGIASPIIFDLDNSKSDQSGSTINSDKMEIYHNGKPVEYSLVVTKPSGSQATETATYNFRRFYQALLTASIEGAVDLTEEEMAALRATPDKDCQLKMTILLDDGLGATRYAVYRFYQITERKSYMTVELLDSPDGPSDPANGQGIFYVSRTFCDKLISDAYRFIEGVEIIVDSKN
ncbi:MAG: InlB B-repeat-containing protein [Clostridia bacterium]|nr:InlB B-repeat-containing protein [Clostridia bacterium]